MFNFYDKFCIKFYEGDGGSSGGDSGSSSTGGATSGSSSSTGNSSSSTGGAPTATGSTTTSVGGISVTQTTYSNGSTVTSWGNNQSFTTNADGSVSVGDTVSAGIGAGNGTVTGVTTGPSATNGSASSGSSGGSSSSSSGGGSTSTSNAANGPGSPAGEAATAGTTANANANAQAAAQSVAQSIAAVAQVQAALDAAEAAVGKADNAAAQAAREAQAVAGECQALAKETHAASQAASDAGYAKDAALAALQNAVDNESAAYEAMGDEGVSVATNDDGSVTVTVTTPGMFSNAKDSYTVDAKGNVIGHTHNGKEAAVDGKHANAIGLAQATAAVNEAQNNYNNAKDTRAAALAKLAEVADALDAAEGRLHDVFAKARAAKDAAAKAHAALDAAQNNAADVGKKGEAAIAAYEAALAAMDAATGKTAEAKANAAKDYEAKVNEAINNAVGPEGAGGNSMNTDGSNSEAAEVAEEYLKTVRTGSIQDFVNQLVTLDFLAGPDKASIVNDMEALYQNDPNSYATVANEVTAFVSEIGHIFSAANSGTSFFGRMAQAVKALGQYFNATVAAMKESTFGKVTSTIFDALRIGVVALIGIALPQAVIPIAGVWLGKWIWHAFKTAIANDMGGARPDNPTGSTPILDEEIKNKGDTIFGIEVDTGDELKPTKYTASNETSYSGYNNGLKQTYSDEDVKSYIVKLTRKSPIIRKLKME